MACENPPCAEVGPFRYCPIEGCGWMEEPPPDPWAVLRTRLQERLTMAREVLDQEGYEDVAALVPIEEVLIWMDEIDAANGRTPEVERALGEQILHYADDETLREHGIDPAQTGSQAAVDAHAVHGHICDPGAEPNCGYNPCIVHRQQATNGSTGEGA